MITVILKSISRLVAAMLGTWAVFSAPSLGQQVLGHMVSSFSGSYNLIGASMVYFNILLGCKKTPSSEL